MNTDARRAAFCAVMGSEDCVDAFERLLRLGLKVHNNPYPGNVLSVRPQWDCVLCYL